MQCESKLGLLTTNELINRFNIGTSTHWPGATIFWQLDNMGTIRTGKIMLFNPNTGKRIREPYNHIAWVHKELEKSGKFSDFQLNQCLFGLHQLANNDTNIPVCIVEAEKTAIIASTQYPEAIWMATGGISNLTYEKLYPLINNTNVLFPDNGAFTIWQNKSKNLNQMYGFKIKVSTILESKIIAQGHDLADVI